MDNILDDLRCLVELISKKCELFQCRVKFLGHVVSVEGVATDPEKVVVVTNWSKPQNVTDVKTFLDYALTTGDLYLLLLMLPALCTN